MTARFFVDSNVLIYSRDVVELEKQRRANDWLRRLWGLQCGRLSYQVIVESYAVLSGSQRIKLQADKARAFVTEFLSWNPLLVDATVLERGWRLQERYRLNWWDCLIVAAAQLTECTYLLTEDMQPGQNLDGLVVVNPFEVEPASLA